MPYAFIIVGVVLLTAGVRRTSGNLLTLVKGDVTGSNNFAYWILSILAIGALGYVASLRTLSRAFLGLLLVVLVLAEDKGATGGFFTKFQQGISQITKG